MKLLILIISFIVGISQLLVAQNCNNYSVVGLWGPWTCNYDPWKLVFEDDFNGNALDPAKWNVQYQGVEADFGFTLEKEWYANTGHIPTIPPSHNIEVSNGTLKLIAKRENPPIHGFYVSDWSTTPPTQSDGYFNFSSGKIISKSAFGYGKYEISCKLPKCTTTTPFGSGFWPAFWMYGQSSTGANNELDVFEFPHGNTNNDHMTVHYDGYDCAGNFFGPDFGDRYHVFTIIWEPEQIQWLVDGVVKRTNTKYYVDATGQSVNCNSIITGTYKLDRSFPVFPEVNIIANLAIEDGIFTPPANVPFPVSLDIDYIRYYKRVPCTGTEVITDMTQLALGYYTNLSQLHYNNDLYNVRTGTNIYLGGVITISQGQQLELIASNSINLSNNFKADFGSDFSAVIDADLCSSDNSRVTGSTKTSISDDQNTNLRSTTIYLENGKTINVFPNPNNGTFQVEFTNDSLSQFQISVYDDIGQELYSNKSIQNHTQEINLSQFSSGKYALIITDSNSKTVYKNMIILEK